MKSILDHNAMMRSSSLGKYVRKISMRWKVGGGGSWLIHFPEVTLAGMMENQFVIGLTITMLRGSAKRDAVVVSIPRLHNLGNRAHQKEIMECRFKPMPCIEHKVYFTSFIRMGKLAFFFPKLLCW